MAAENTTTTSAAITATVAFSTRWSRHHGGLHYRIIPGRVVRIGVGCRAGSSIVADEREAEKKKGPKGGVKHTPGRGHNRKSGPAKKMRFQKRAARIRQQEQESLRKQWEEWDAMPPEVQKFLPDKKPKLPRPTDEG
jgi:hypothetical protein